MKRSIKWTGVCLGFLSVLGVGFVAGRARAGGVPSGGALTYGGLLHDAKGAPLAGPEYLEIQFWDDPRETSGKNLLCDTGTPALTTLLDGRFSIALPDECAEAVAAHPDIYVDVIVGPSREEAASLGVRSKLGAVPYALEAGNASRLDGKPASAYQLRVGDACPDGEVALSIDEDGKLKCGALVTGWTEFTPNVVLSSSGFPAVTAGIENNRGMWRRVGDSIEVSISTGFTAGSVDDSILIWSLPKDVVIDAAFANRIGGSAEVWNGTAASVCLTAAYPDYAGIALDCQGGGSLRRSDMGAKGSGKGSSAGLRYSMPVKDWTLTSP